MADINKYIKVIGAGVGKINVNPIIKDHVDWADIVVGGKRLLNELDCTETKKRFIIKGDIKVVLEKIESAVRDGKKVLVISDGDPLFFGIGKKIIHKFGINNVEIHPNITVAQIACARLGISFDQMKVVSLHGKKDFFPILSAMMNYEAIGIYTDNTSGPKKIADELIKRDIKEFSMIILEDLGTSDEKIREFDIKDVLNNHFSQLNFVVLKRKAFSKPANIKVGMEDGFYIHEQGLITKREIRAISISKLDLNKNSIIWDIGGGCGSIAIECSAIARNGKIFCIEKSLKRIHMIRQNIKKAKAYIVEPIFGKAPECLKTLPAADRVFIGGGLSKNPEILEYVGKHIKNKGIIVMNIALIESLTKAISFFHKNSWKFELIQVVVSKSNPIAKSIALISLNPIFIIKAEKAL